MNIKINSLFIEQFKGFKDFKITFEKDVTLLVGENGTGKTTIFEIIFNLLSGNTEYFKYPNFTKIELNLQKEDKEIKMLIQKKEDIEVILNDKIINKENDFFNIRKVAYLPAEVAFTNYTVNGPAKMEENLKDIKLDSKNMSKDLKQFLVNEKFLDLNDIAQGNVNSATRILAMKELFNVFLDGKKFIDIDVKTFEPIFELNETKEKITLDDLSSGEKQIFYKGGSLLQYTKENSAIILIDEPETSLHPEWQQKILKFYKKVNINNQYIFATHSPHIVSCCNKKEIRVIEKDGDYLKLKEDISETYGVTAEELLYNIFDMSSVRNIEVQK